jgi:hypothetical protein
MNHQNSQINPSDLFTKQQVARLAGVGPVQIWYDIKKGKLRATKVGYQWVITPEAVADYLARRRAGEFRVGGLNFAQIARELHLDQETVAKWVRAKSYTIASTNTARKSKLDPYKVIIQRWLERLHAITLDNFCTSFGSWRPLAGSLVSISIGDCLYHLLPVRSSGAYRLRIAA